MIGKCINKLRSIKHRAAIPEAAQTIDLLYPIGHFYSPIADPEDIRARQQRIWAKRDTMAGIDMNVEGQRALCAALKPHLTDIDYPVSQPNNQTQYFYGNDQYPVLDAEFLHGFLRHTKPKNMIEVGSGFSSLITADVNRRYFDSKLNFVCIEPYPRQFLIDGVPGIHTLVQKKVEDIEPSSFNKLGDGDILFIDSSHVSKIGSDVNYLFFEVLPRLQKGVVVHIHDIFLPDEYPEIWVYQGRNWNEQYLLRALLQGNHHWQILWASHFMGTRHTAAVQATFPRYPELGGGGSIWIKKVN